jgi:hypothetical protein
MWRRNIAGALSRSTIATEHVAIENNRALDILDDQQLRDHDSGGWALMASATGLRTRVGVSSIRLLLSELRGVRPHAEPASDHACERRDTDRDEAVDGADPGVIHPQMAEQELQEKRSLEREGPECASPRGRREDDSKRTNSNEDASKGAVRVVARGSECSGSSEEELSGDTNKHEASRQAVEA